MKRIISTALVMLMALSFVTTAFATGDTSDSMAELTASISDIKDIEQENPAEDTAEPAQPEDNRDYMAIMINAAMSGDYTSGVAAQDARNAKIDHMGINAAKVYFEDLYILAKIISSEAGSSWLSDEWKMCVGEVVLNRVASPEFPDSVSAVVMQRGQYAGANSTYFQRLKPSERCVLLAKRLLEGERIMNAPAVVFQANFRQGSGTHTSYYDRLLGSTYFCYSSKMHLYENV